DRDLVIRLALGQVRGARDVGLVLHRHDGEGDATSADTEHGRRHCEEEQTLLPVHRVCLRAKEGALSRKQGTSQSICHTVWSTSCMYFSPMRPPCTLMLERAVSISRRS